MKVVHFVWSLRYGGIETMLVDIINQQVKSIEVCLVVVNDEIDNEIVNSIDNRCQIFYCNRIKGSRSILPFVRLNLYLWKLKADIYHFHSADIKKTLFFQSSINVRTVHNTHFSDNDYKEYKRLFAISQSVQKKLKEIGLKSDLVYNGVVTNSIQSSQVQEQKNVLNFVQIGRLYMKHKGQHILLEAISKLIEKGHKNFKVTFIGDGPDKAELEKKAQILKIDEYVCWMSAKDRKYIYNHLCEYDTLIQPSLSEGFGLTVIEGMCAKIPVVVCDQEGPMEVTEDGKYAMLFKTGNSNDLASKMESIIKGEYDYSNLEDARNYAKNKFDISNTVHQYLMYYKEMLKNI